MENPTATDDSTWHRVKWTDEMVRLLIAAVSSLDADPNPSPSARIGKWKQVSALMAQHSFSASPQQCEDKFNDLSKRYKRLNEILGRGTSCDVVENPSLLSSMPHISEKDKRTVTKILASKQLFYREMCAYFNGHRIPNPESLDLPALRDYGEGEGCRHSEGISWIRLRMAQLEEERVEIERERLDLTKRRMKWMRFRSKKEWEMERKELENERMLLENQRTMVMMKRKRLELGTKRGREADNCGYETG